MAEKKNDKHGSAQGNKEAVFKESEGAACPEYFTEILQSPGMGKQGRSICENIRPFLKGHGKGPEYGKKEYCRCRQQT